MVFKDIDTNVILTIDDESLYYEKGRKGGWAVLGKLPEYDGSNCDDLEPWQINEDILIYLI